MVVGGARQALRRARHRVGRSEDDQRVGLDGRQSPSAAPMATGSSDQNRRWLQIGARGERTARLGRAHVTSATLTGSVGRVRHRCLSGTQPRSTNSVGRPGRSSGTTSWEPSAGSDAGASHFGAVAGGEALARQVPLASTFSNGVGDGWAAATGASGFGPVDFGRAAPAFQWSRCTCQNPSPSVMASIRPVPSAPARRAGASRGPATR